MSGRDSTLAAGVGPPVTIDHKERADPSDRPATAESFTSVWALSKPSKLCELRTLYRR